MTDLLDAFKKKAEDMVDSINRSGGLRGTIEALRRQMAEADRKRAMSRAKSEVKRLNQQVAEMVSAVGLQAVSLQEAGKLTAPELQPLCQHIISLKAEITKQEQELAKLIAETEAEAARQAAPPVTPGPSVLPESSASAAVVAVPASAGNETKCSNCGKPILQGALFCAYCGFPTTTAQPSVPEDERFCISCGSILRPGAKFCSKCGTVVRSPG
ncbi:MAG: zinc ribbon domain-containing protein [Anaerolineae bacterium]